MNNTVNIEIERKFLVKELPIDIENKLVNCIKYDIIQCYLNNEYDSIDVRIRNINNNEYFMEIKDKGDIMRNEISISITKEQFNDIYTISKAKSIHKTRYILNKTDNSTLVLDIYNDKLKDLIVVEYESTDFILVNNFKPEYWFMNEITNDIKYKNRNLAINGTI